jgi:hypothetical protein
MSSLNAHSSCCGNLLKGGDALQNCAADRLQQQFISCVNRVANGWGEFIAAFISLLD